MKVKGKSNLKRFLNKRLVYRVVAFVPQGDIYEEGFREYIDYFEKKQRVGLAFLDKGIMFLLPPSALSREYFTSERPHMVGIFGDQQAAAA